MPRTALSLPTDTVSLREALARRRSAHATIAEPIPFSTLSGILHTLSMNATGSRQHPSGGAKYPIETYVFIQRAEDLPRGAYHYHPPTHSLEHLFEIPEEIELCGGVNEWANDARVLIVLTAGWWKNAEKYRDFGYLLGILESGHMAQNVLLGAAAANVPACPLGGFNDDRVAELLDLDLGVEQPVYCIALA